MNIRHYGRETIALVGETQKPFEVISGGVATYRIMRDGRKQILAFYMPGDLVDGADVLDMNIEAVAETTIRYTEKHSRPIDLIEREVRDLRNLAFCLGRKTAIERISGFLVSMFDRYNENEKNSNINLFMSRHDIADYLGVTIETVSRNITKLRTMQYIRLHSTSVIEILDYDALLKIANGA